MQRLTVLYDDRCGLCSGCRRWMEEQDKILNLEFVPMGSPEAQARWGPLGGPADELLVVDDEGGVYRGADAWILCLYALTDYRVWALMLAQPPLKPPLARVVFRWVSRNRRALWGPHPRTGAAPLEALPPGACPRRGPGFGGTR